MSLTRIQFFICEIWHTVAIFLSLVHRDLPFQNKSILHLCIWITFFNLHCWCKIFIFHKTFRFSAFFNSAFYTFCVDCVNTSYILFYYRSCFRLNCLVSNTFLDFFNVFCVELKVFLFTIIFRNKFVVIF